MPREMILCHAYALTTRLGSRDSTTQETIDR
jgi:hypothetical protein